MLGYIVSALIFITVSCGKSKSANERRENSDSCPQVNQALEVIDSELNEQEFFAESASGFVVYILFKENIAYLSKANGNSDIFTYSLAKENNESDYQLILKNKNNQNIANGTVSATKEIISIEFDDEEFRFFKRDSNTKFIKQVLISENRLSNILFHSDNMVSIQLEDGTNADYTYYISPVLTTKLPFRQNLEGLLTDKAGLIIGNIAKFKNLYGLDVTLKKEDADIPYVFYSPEELQIIKNKK